MSKEIVLFKKIIFTILVIPLFITTSQAAIRIAFLLNNDIWITDEDNNNPEKITDSPLAIKYYPRLSPEGETIAFYSNQSGRFELWLINCDGTQLRQITNNQTRYQIYGDGGPAWSKDGQWIFFNSSRPGDGEIWKIKVDGTGLVQLTNVSGQNTQSFDISPSGSLATFVRGVEGNGYTNKLFVDNIDFSDPVMIQANHAPHLPKISPDGKKIAYNDVSCNTRVIDISGENDILVIQSFWPSAWHPSGEKLLVVSTNWDHIFWINSDGTNLKYFAAGHSPSIGGIKNEIPRAICKNISREALIDCQVSVTPEDINYGSFDPDGGDVTLSVSPDLLSGLGDHNVVLTVTDDEGTSASCTAVVTVVDRTPPVPEVDPLPVLTGQCSVEVTTKPLANDNCAGRFYGETTDPLKYAEQGTYSITWIYNDGNGNIATQTQTVIVKDTVAPVPDLAALPNLEGQCSVDVTTIPAAMDNCVGKVIGQTSSPLHYSSQGTYTIIWSFNDGHGNFSFQNQLVIVKDTLPPIVFRVVATPNVLWPPNHKMIPIVVSIAVTDNCGGAIASRIIDVTSNEPINGLGDGDAAPDWEITRPLALNLRAERSGTGTGRIYTIKIESRDHVGLITISTVTVEVPKSQGR